MKIKVVESVMKDNDRIAQANRETMNKVGLVALNITSAPGSGKTTLLKKTMEALGPDHEAVVLVGVILAGQEREEVEENLQELGLLAKTAGARVLGSARSGEGQDG